MDHQQETFRLQRIRSNFRRGFLLCKGDVMDCFILLSWNISVSCHIVSDTCIDLNSRPKTAWTGAEVSSYSFAATAPSGHVLFAWSEKKMCMWKKKEALFDFIKYMICAICFLAVFCDYLNTQMYLFLVKETQTQTHTHTSEPPKWKQGSFLVKRFWSGSILCCLICYLTVSPTVISTVPTGFVWIYSKSLNKEVWL